MFAAVRGFIVVSFLTLFANGCGDVFVTSPGSLVFSPSTVTLENSSLGTSTQVVSITVRSSLGALLPETPILCSFPLHGRIPFSGAGSTAAFLDANGSALSITAPGGATNQGTLLVGETNSTGRFEFTIQFPFGDYQIMITCFAARASGDFNLTLSSGS